MHEFAKQVTGLGGGSGTQGGSGHTPLSFEWRRAVAGPAGTGFRGKNGKICVCPGGDNLWPEVPDDSSGSLARGVTVRRTVVGTGAILCTNLGGLNASLRASRPSA